MPSPKNLSTISLILLGVSFAGGNLWFAFARSTIPLELQGLVTDKQNLIEKTPGVDDVYIVTLDVNRCIQFDRLVFDAIAANQTVKKRAWMTIIEIEGKSTSLTCSHDFHGMIWAMPLTVCVLHGMIVVFHLR